MLLYPDFYCENIKYVDIKKLKENNIKGIILDVDNTLIDLDHNILEDAEEWCNKLKEQNIKFCILSNSNKKEKVKKIADEFGIPYRIFAKKPLKSGFLKVQKQMKEKTENIAVIGDQIFTDVIGGNRCGFFTILVEPIHEKDYWFTAWKRPIEEKIKNNYQAKEKK